MHPSSRRALGALLEARHGVLSRQLLVRAGLHHELPSREVEAGRWQRLLPGIYLTSPEPPTLVQRCHAAVLHGGRSAVITGNAACVLREVPGAQPDDDSVTLLVPRGMRRVSNAWCRLVRTTSLPPGDTVQGLPVVATERAVADAIRTAADLAQARARACAVARQVDWDALVHESSQPIPGSAYLTQVVRDLEDGVRSAPEGELHDLVRHEALRGAFPPYLLNPDVFLDGHLVGSPDLWVVGLGLGDEMDSRAWHEEQEQLDGTLLRHERFRQAGLLLAHVTPIRFRRDPYGHLGHLRGLVVERAQLRVPEPEGLVVLGRGPLLPYRSPWPQVSDNRRGLGRDRRRFAA